MNGFELRTLAEPVEFRSTGGHLTASGVAMRYGSISKDLGGFRERVLPGAYRQALADSDVRAVREHDRRLLLGRTGNGTLRFHDTRQALRYDLDLPDTTAGRETATMLERGDLNGSSVAMPVKSIKAEWSKTSDGHALRTVRESGLDHLALTGWNAYDDSTAELALRSLAEDTGLDLPDLVAAARVGRLGGMISHSGRSERRQQVVVYRRGRVWAG